MSNARPSDAPTPTLGSSARTAMVWGGGFTLLRDVVQFATMLALVRLLTPADYGNAALAQSVIGLISVISFGTLVLHALQIRDPSEVDWQTHFTAAVVINTFLFCLTLVIAWGFSFSVRYQNVSLPLAGLSLVFLVEILGTLRHRMLETQHNWKRFRLLLIMGTVLGSVTGFTVALLGGGVWGLIVQVPLFGLPAAIDLFVSARWRPQWSWSWLRYRDTARFGVSRMGAAILVRGRQTAEQAVMAGAYDFAALGVFTRSVGLATLIAGRIGAVAMMSLYPVLTRVEQHSERFRYIAGLVLRGVCWTTVPAAASLALCASDTVALIYGSQWNSVVPLLPLAVAGVALMGIASTLSSILLANNELRACLLIDFVSAGVGVGLALWLVPIGVEIYLAALVAHGILVVALAIGLLILTGGIDGRGFVVAFLPAIIAGAAGMAVVVAVRDTVGSSGIMLVRLALEPLLFCIVYLAVLRLAFERPMRELLNVAPGGNRLCALLAITPRIR